MVYGEVVVDVIDAVLVELGAVELVVAESEEVDKVPEVSKAEED